MYAVSKCAPQEALRNLDRAFDGFFRRVKLKKVGQYRGNLGFPKYKTKKRGLGGFRLTGTISVSPDAVHLPRLGRLRLKDRGYLPTGGVQVLSATVTEQAGPRYVSVLVEKGHVGARDTGPVVVGMLKNHSLALAISDVGWGTFRRQLTYKAAWYGGRVVVADRWFTSSKTCCRCGWVDEQLTLSERTFRCQNPACGLVIDRDLNAATNLEQLAGSSPDRINACGEGSAGASLWAGVKLPSLKQEPKPLSASA